MKKGSRRFQATLPELDKIMHWVRGVFASLASSGKQCRQWELVVEEAVVNVMHYAYAHPPGILEIDYKIEDKKVILQIKDQGRAFNPLEKGQLLSKDLPLEHREEGGMGIHLILQIADRVDYDRVGEWNILTVSLGRD